MLLLLSCSIYGQTDTSVYSVNMMDEVIVTSNKTSTRLGNVTVPVSLISQKTIFQNGSLRLKDILQEQTGLYITNGFGAGIQMQGLNPDYTLILLNGEPLTGRTAGVLDVNRISIDRIKRIEIVKGPSSSLYGSEAMAGVINIITEKSLQNSFNTGLRYGFGNPEKGWSVPAGNGVFKNLDFNLGLDRIQEKTSWGISTNSYYLDGISYRPYSTQRFPQPVWRLTQQFNLSHQFQNAKFNLVVRNAYDHIKQEFAVTNNGAISNSFGKEENKDLNINPSLQLQLKKNLQSSFRLYGTLFNGRQELRFTDKPDSVYLDAFKQQFYRAEHQTDWTIKKMKMIAGAGYSIDIAQSTRYDNIANTKKNNITYGFLQHEWNPNDKLTFIAGVRYDHNRLFDAAWSPKLSFRFKAAKNLNFNASVGRGFKAPDFRQLYLNFTNNAAGGYSVLGAVDAVSIINTLQQQGLISEIKSDFLKLQSLKPEFSTGINAGGNWQISNQTFLQVNIFRNDIEGMIDSRQVATRVNGSQIFSYINLKNAYTQGIEGTFGFPLWKNLQITWGYQYLKTADKDDLDQIKAGKVFTRNDDGTSRILQLSEYAGLPNRSKHMANVKLNYENKKRVFATARCIYRSRWYVADSDGNGIYNTNDEYASGFVLVNLSVGKTFTNGITVNGGIDNLTNHQNINYLPNLQGRMIYTAIHFKIK